MADRRPGSHFASAFKEGFMRASYAATALRQGDPSLGRALLASWRFADDPETLDAALGVVQAARPRPPPGLCLADGDLPRARPGNEDAFADELQWRARRWDLAASESGEVSPDQILAWTLHELTCWAQWLRRGERAWDGPVRLEPALDAMAAAAWANLLGGQPFGASPYLMRHLMPPAARIFRSVMLAADLPGFEIKRVQRDLSEGFLSLLLAEREGVPVWLDLALRTLERGSQGPVAALSAQVRSWGTAASCLARKRSWGDTLRAIWPDLVGPEIRALHLRDRLESSQGALPATLDLHLLCRLCRTWTEGGTEATRPDQAYALLRRNLGRVRARLRAMLAETPEVLLAPLLGTEGLHAATLAATRRMAWAFARRELETGFSMSFARAAIPGCALEVEEELSPDDQAALPTWALLVVLRGRLPHLRRWIARGTTEDHDATWGRLLSVALPASLRPPTGGRHHRLRAALRGRLPELLRAHLPVIRQVAGLEAGRGLRAAFERLLRPSWHPAVPFPQRDFPSLVRNALASLPELLLEER